MGGGQLLRHRGHVGPLTKDAIPLFPLGVVLFPDGMLPLRIFEVRYLSMVRHCHRTGQPFGVVSLMEGDEVQRPGSTVRERFHAVGTMAQILEYDAPQPGLIEVITRGTQRFRITATEQTPHGLWMGDVVPLPPDPPMDVPSDLTYVAASLVRMTDVFNMAEVSPILEPKRFDEAGWAASTARRRTSGYPSCWTTVSRSSCARTQALFRSGSTMQFGGSERV